MILKGGYTSPRSCLHVEIVSVYYQNSEYAKVKLYLFDKFTGRGVYDPGSKNYKLYFDRIDHWVRVESLRYKI